MKQKRQAPYSYGIPQEYSHLHLPPKDFFSEIEVQDFPIRGKAVYLRVKMNGCFQANILAVLAI